MRSTVLLASIGMLATVLNSPVLAGDRDDGHDRDRSRVANTRSAGTFDHGMKAVPNNAGPNDWGHGWQYFSDPAARRAVVISPQGDYYYSRGKGLRRVAAAEPMDRDWLAIFEWDAGHQSIARSRESQWIEKEIRR